MSFGTIVSVAKRKTCGFWDLLGKATLQFWMWETMLLDLDYGWEHLTVG